MEGIHPVSEANGRSERAAMLCGGRGGRSRDGGGSLTRPAQDGRGAAAAPARLPGALPAARSGDTRPAPRVQRSRAESGPALWGRAGLPRGAGTGGQQWRRGCERCPRRSLAGRARGRPWPREGRASEQRPVLGAPGAGQRAAVRQVTQLVKVTMDSSPYFKLVGPNGVCHQIPPGSFCTINILFIPEGSKSLFLQDHFHQLVCSSEREKVSVPIRAIGAHPVLDFPDQLDFSSCPVNHSTQKTLLVHNTGNLEACYSLSTESPFTASPATGTLDVGEAKQVTVEYHPLETGHHCTSLAVHCDRGEDTHTRLLGKAKDFNIGLDKYSLELVKPQNHDHPQQK
ncbi:hydrocephalus-inducing protein homolog isoform X1 [Manacus candei]|uniref:hydrocephalus-inducing protein homolog isoform X1 n=1 Tax=Manacus candei TaxID=415023 RepID=UPI002227A501|nr:hydrocephalus-inducing protein homolog isoform X1 [Manacus candei]